MTDEKMTVEQAVVAKLKGDPLASIIDDSEMLLECASRAIQEALYQPSRVLKQFGGYEEKDSPVVEAAREAARIVALKVADEMMLTLMKEPDFRRKVAECIALSLPVVFKETWFEGFGQMAREQGDELSRMVEEHIKIRQSRG